MIQSFLVVSAWLVLATHGATRLSISQVWNGGFKSEPCIPITTTLHGGWKAHLQFSMDVESVEVWNSQPLRLSNREYLLTNNWETLEAGKSLCFAFVVRTNGQISPEISFWFEAGANPTDSPGTNPGGGNSSNKDYGQALAKSILFYDAQRSGKLPANNPIPWRGDSALGDCVTGGWYDAGDHVKFGLPMAASTHLLAWSLVKFKDGYVKAGQLDMMYDMIKWPLDYFLKGWQTSRFIAQVGDGNADHAFWGRPEDMTMGRPCQWIEGNNPGADIAGESAAALAAASIAFKDQDATYAGKLKSAAQSLYGFAQSHGGIFTGSAPFYGSSGDQDEMCVGAMWLYRATGESHYLQEAKTKAQTDTAWSLSWDDKRLACQILLYEETKDTVYKQAIENFFTSWSKDGGMKYTPCGLAWRDKWGANRYAGNSAFAALLAAEAGLHPDNYRKWAVEQINYLLGDNDHNGGCFSFEIGYGGKFPQHPHHRGASVSGKELTGALVGGPDHNDYYNDDQTNYVMNEVATDYNSGFQGALAALTYLDSIGKIPQTSTTCPCRA